MPKRLALICFLSLVMLMSILGNLLVMVAVCKDRQLRWEQTFILLYCHFYPFLTFLKTNELIFGNSTANQCCVSAKGNTSPYQQVVLVSVCRALREVVRSTASQLVLVCVTDRGRQLLDHRYDFSPQ